MAIFWVREMILDSGQYGHGIWPLFASMSVEPKDRKDTDKFKMRAK